MDGEEGLSHVNVWEAGGCSGTHRELGVAVRKDTEVFEFLLALLGWEEAVGGRLERSAHAACGALELRSNSACGVLRVRDES